ncbi:unnamed protein product, partial [Heterosigma akashiwo]
MFDHRSAVLNDTMYIFGGRHMVRTFWSGSVWALPLNEIDDSRLTPAHAEFLSTFG